MWFKFYASKPKMQRRSGSGIVPGTGIFELEISRAGISGSPELHRKWLSQDWGMVLISTGNCARKFHFTGTSECTKKNIAETTKSRLRKCSDASQKLWSEISIYRNFRLPSEEPSEMAKSSMRSVLISTGNSSKKFHQLRISEWPSETWRNLAKERSRRRSDSG